MRKCDIVVITAGIPSKNGNGVLILMSCSSNFMDFYKHFYMDFYMMFHKNFHEDSYMEFHKL